MLKAMPERLIMHDNDDPRRQTSAHQRLAGVERVCPLGGVVFFQVDKLLRANLIMGA